MSQEQRDKAFHNIRADLVNLEEAWGYGDVSSLLAYIESIRLALDELEQLPW